MSEKTPNKKEEGDESPLLGKIEREVMRMIAKRYKVEKVEKEEEELNS